MSMGIKCDMCDREASVHEVVVVNGERRERHLCEEHAQEAGVLPTKPGPDTISAMMQKMVAAQHLSTESPKQAAQSCPQCGLSFAKFRAEGLLGCPACYDAFADRIVPLLVRAHDGGEHHVGRVPKRAGALVERQQRLMALRRELGEAVAQEQYERAAKLRDEIGMLEQPNGDAEDAGERLA
ncbi:MAG: UvrB/UvrC motif-containing protein [Phycisphaerales bacterium]|nr:UvrB/UvrC motif-containing protein [Phycisphaerales bacterium]